MKSFFAACLLSLTLLFPITSTSYAKECMDKTKLEQTIKENLGPEVSIYATMAGPEVQTFLQALATLVPGMPTPPDMDTIHVVPEGAVAIIVAMKDGCVVGAARIPALVYFEAKRMLQTAAE